MIVLTTTICLVICYHIIKLGDQEMLGLFIKITIKLYSVDLNFDMGDISLYSNIFDVINIIIFLLYDKYILCLLSTLTNSNDSFGFSLNN